MDSLSEYLKGFSRNKIILIREPIHGINPIDIGKLFSERLNNVMEDKRFSLNAKMCLEEILDTYMLDSEDLGKYLAIKNIGILLENQLNIDFRQLLEKYSKDNVLIVQWEGEINNDNLYFLNKETGIKINLKNISHITV